MGNTQRKWGSQSYRIKEKVKMRNYFDFFTLGFKYGLAPTIFNFTKHSPQ